MRSRNLKAFVARAGVDRRREPVAVAVGQLHRLVERRELRHADDRPEGLGRVDLVVGGHAARPASGGRRCRRPGRRRSPRAGSSAVIRPARDGAVDRVVVADRARASPRSARRSARGSSARRGRPRSGRRSATTPAARRAWRRTRRRPTRARSRCPSDVQRWPAVPKPPNSAPSTARSTSASSITTIGFLPPSSRHGDCRWRPQSSPIFEPTALEPGEADLVDQTLVRAPARGPRTCPRPTPGTTFSTPPGTPPAWNSSRQRVAQRGASTRPASTRPSCRTGSPARGTRPGRRPGSCPR